MKKTFLKGKNPELYFNINKDKSKNIKEKREKRKYTSGFASEMQTDEVFTPSESSLRGTRGASTSSEKPIGDYYKEAAADLQTNPNIYAINVDVCSPKEYKGRRQMNIDIFFTPNSLPFKYTVNMVEREFKYEIFRDKKPNYVADSWQTVTELYASEKEGVYDLVIAGKMRNRTRNTKVIPRNTIPNCLCALVTSGAGTNAHILLHNSEYVIPIRDIDNKTDGNKGLFFIGTGLWCNNTYQDNDYDLDELNDILENNK